MVRVSQTNAEDREVIEQSHGRASSENLWPGWIPFLVLPAAAIAVRPFLESWCFMWTLAAAIFYGCKWQTWWERTVARRVAEGNEMLAGWVGMLGIILVLHLGALKMVRWMGIRAELVPAPGGLYFLDPYGHDVIRGSYLDVVPIQELYSRGGGKSPVTASRQVPRLSNSVWSPRARARACD